MSKQTEQLLCPSYIAKEGAHLLGVKQKDGTIGILPKPLHVTEAFFQVAQQNGIKPEEHFRFVGSCMVSGCKQWTNNSCSIASRAVELINLVSDSIPLPTCSIRPTCQWYFQEKSNACKVCKFVITETPD